MELRIESWRLLERVGDKKGVLGLWEILMRCYA